MIVERNTIHSFVSATPCQEGFFDEGSSCGAFSGNTCRNAARGIWQNWRQNFSLTVDSDTFENLSGPALEYESGSVGNASTLTSNQFINTGPVIYSNTTANSEAEINSLPGAANNQVQ